jgi:hypothetical protein
MEDYIMKNTHLRVKAKTCGDLIEAELLKLMNNSVFGKHGENVWGRVKTSYVNNIARFKAKVESSNVLDVQKITNDFACVFSMPAKVDLCKSVHVLTAIFDLGKMHMFSAWYDAIRPAFPSAKLHMTDTD